MIDAIISGLVAGAVGYLLPQPKWAAVLQTVVWDWLKRKFTKG